MTRYLNINATIKARVFSALTLSTLLLGNIVVAAVPGFLQTQPASAIKAKFVEDEVLVKFKSNITAQARQSIMSKLGGQSSAPVGKKLRVSKIKLQKGLDVMTAALAYQANPNIEHAQPNYIYYTSAIPNDTSFNQLWGLKNTGQTITNPKYTTNNPGVAGYDIDAETAWDEITDCRSVVVAVIDTGINYTHQDLSGNMWDGSGSGFPNHGYDFVDDDNDPMPVGGSEDHGTHVAGTIGAYGNNGLGITGVCWRANIMSVRVINESGFATTANIISGVEFASDNGAGVINMSLGEEGFFDSLSNDAVNYARDRDVVVVVAAGNGGADSVSDDNDGLGDDGVAFTKFYPCSFAQDNLICVAALDQSYSLASFSNYGAVSVDVGAPGINTLSSYAGQKITDNFATGWTLNGWTRSNLCTSVYVLINPSDWCSNGTYGFNVDDRAFKTFDLSISGIVAAELTYGVDIDTQAGVDLFYTAMKSSGGDPFAGGGSTLQVESGSSSGFTLPFSHDISSCLTPTCSLGYRLTSNLLYEGTGMAIGFFSIETLQTNSTSYYLANGTSMATPHVAGIAAMLQAFNPNYSYAQVVEAIKNGGEVVAALSGITTTGRAANAMGALAYITAPTGLTAVVQ